jgi:signal transduction histidine kinase
MGMKSTSSGAKTTDITASEKQALQFVSMFVHDLEGPLVSMKTLLRLLEREKFDQKKPAHQALLTSANIALNRAEVLIYDLLTAARSGESNLAVDLKDCNLNRLITDSCLMAEPSAQENRVRIIMKLPEKDTIVRADELLVGRVLDNLIFNGIRHAPPNSNVTIEVRPGKTEVEIAVSDTGPGFEDMDPEDLFTIFKQTDYRVRGLHRGVGVGLYLCRLAVDKMDGNIQAENSPDGGALFRFTLPVRRKHHEDGS